MSRYHIDPERRAAALKKRAEGATRARTWDDARAGAVPCAMREAARWIVWRSGLRDGKPTKFPVCTRGGWAKSTDPETWSTFEEACAAYNADETLSGIGFCLGEGWMGADIDHCGVPPVAWAQEVIETLASYTEVSPSGSGLRVLMRGSLPPDCGNKKEIDGTAKLELYDWGRYLTITGQAVEGTAGLSEASDRVAAVAHRFGMTGKKSRTTLTKVDLPAVAPAPLTAKELEALERQHHPGLSLILTRDRPDLADQTQSTYDAALIAFCSRAGLSVETTWALLRTMREAYDDKPGKALDRDGYIARSFAFAWGRDTEAAPTVTATAWEWKDPATLPRRQWLYGRHYVRKYMTATFAPGGVGKSSLGIVEALSMVTGRDLLRGGVTARPLRVWLFNGEDPREELDRRIVAAMRHHSVTPEEVAGRLFVNSGRDTELILGRQDRDGVKVFEPVVGALKAEIAAHEIDVLIVDPFVSTHRMNENDNNAIEAVAKAWARLADATNASVDLVHHTRKATAGSTAEPTADDGRGASALKDASRGARVLRRMTKTEAEQAGVEEHWRYFSLGTGKENMAPPAKVRPWYRLESVGLGNGDDDGPEDNVGVVEAWAWPEPGSLVTSEQKIEILRQLRGGECREDRRSSEWAGHAIADVLGLDTEQAGALVRVQRLLQKWLADGTLCVVERKDKSRKARRFVVVGDAHHG